MKCNYLFLATGLLFSLTTLNSQASLKAYNSEGQSVVYSSVSNITWTGDGNLLGSLEASNPNLVSTIISTVGSITDTPKSVGIHTLTAADFGADGLVTWFGAKAFVNYLSTTNYAGSNQWALPTAGNGVTTQFKEHDQTGYNQTSGQIGQLWYNELGNEAAHETLDNPYFTNVDKFVYSPDPGEKTFYWTGTEYNADPKFEQAFIGTLLHFDTSGGFQDFGYPQALFRAWAVAPGQLSTVPVSGSVWLFSTGILGLLGLQGLKRRSRTRWLIKLHDYG